MLQQLQSDLEYSKKLKQQIRSDIVVCSEVNSGFMDELNNFVYDETKRLQLDLVESNELQNEQHLFLKQQVFNLRLHVRLTKWTRIELNYNKASLS